MIGLMMLKHRRLSRCLITSDPAAVLRTVRFDLASDLEATFPMIDLPPSGATYLSHGWPDSNQIS
jgi:hypothetical protein